MKYILDCDLDDYILACRSIQVATTRYPPEMWPRVVSWENGDTFMVYRNKRSYRVVKETKNCPSCRSK